MSFGPRLQARVELIFGCFRLVGTREALCRKHLPKAAVSGWALAAGYGTRLY